MSRATIPVASPVLSGNELAYVSDCITSTWISSQGSYIHRFEEVFAPFTGVEYAIACCNGTAALHLALVALGIGPGDEVIVPTLTFVATANAVRYCGATPVFVDSEPGTWNLDPRAVEERITDRTRCVIPVHLYGLPADMDEIAALADRHGLAIVEDAAEAHGATYRGRPAGSLGSIGTFSFYGNKIVTTGEGGMLTTSDAALDARIRQLLAQGADPKRRYWFPVEGFNYRMTNVAAAIGVAQMETVAERIERYAEIAGLYRRLLADVPAVSWQEARDDRTHANWMFTVVLDADAVDRDSAIASLAEKGIETRPVFHPMHTLPIYEEAHGSYPVAERIGAQGLSLPTWAGLTDDDVAFVCEAVAELVG